MDEELVLLKFNNKELDELNPLISKGYSLILTETIPAELTIKNQQQTQQELFLLKIYTKKVKQQIHHIIIDILTDQDIFFHYRCQLDSESFKTLNTQQQISVTFDSFPFMLCKLVSETMKKQVKIYLTVMPEEYVLFSFHKTVNFKEVNLISLTAVKPSAGVVNQLLAYRYNYLKTEIEKMNGRLMDVREKLKVNPQLLLQFNKICSE